MHGLDFILSSNVKSLLNIICYLNKKVESVNLKSILTGFFNNLNAFIFWKKILSEILSSMSLNR